MTRGGAGMMLVGTALLGAAWGSPAFAQAATPPPAHEGSAEFALVATSGNTSTQTIGLAGDLTFRPSKWVYRAKAAYVQNEVQGVLSARTITSTFRGSRNLTKAVSLFSQVGYMRDRFSGIAHRTSLEAGVSGAWERGRQSFGTDVAAGYANERRVVGVNLSNALFAAGTHYKVKMSANADFTDEFRYSQSLQTKADFRMDHVASVTAKLTTLFSLKVSNTVRYVNAPVAGFKTTDTITSMAVVAKF
jgi:putative salt-induced outer membrane protein YdiY